MENKRIYILGEEWLVAFKSEKDDEILNSCNGYCDYTINTIIVKKLEREVDSYANLDFYVKKVIRHELIHAFLDESGLMENSNWARNEEMVDWFAAQYPKIKKVFEKLEVEE